MTASTLSTENKSCFQFKASFAPCAILQMTRYDLAALDIQLNAAIQRAPNFFIGSPVLIDLEKIPQIEDLDFAKIKQVLIGHGLAPMGVRGGNEKQMQEAATAGLPTVNIGKSAADAPKKKVEEVPVPVAVTSKLVTTAIRSGMQVYAKGGDLIVTAHVSPGAELLADGHIHVYGTLRGRALAGVQGNASARIFCHKLEAELVSIAGFYLTKDDIHDLPENHSMIQIYLENENVQIKGI